MLRTCPHTATRKIFLMLDHQVIFLYLPTSLVETKCIRMFAASKSVKMRTAARQNHSSNRRSISRPGISSICRTTLLKPRMSTVHRCTEKFTVLGPSA